MKKETAIGLGIGGAVLAAGAYILLKRAAERKKYYKKAGDKYGAKLRFNHFGPADRVWIGFGLGAGHKDPAIMTAERWLGKWVDVPEHVGETLCEVKLEGKFPPGLPVGKKIDANKVIIKATPPFPADVYARRLDDDWDDEVYLVEG